jgi:hypothetical protein
VNKPKALSAQLARPITRRAGEILGGRLTIEKQYQGEPRKGARDEYVAERVVPVHPELAARLAAWKLAGFREVYGRPPRDTDFIVPRPRDDQRAQSYNVISKAHRRAERAAAIEHVPRGATHRFRKAASTTACNEEHGPAAAEEIIQSFTHTGRRREVWERYRRWTWPTLCAAVQCIRLELPDPAKVISMEARRGS